MRKVIYTFALILGAVFVSYSFHFGVSDYCMDTSNNYPNATGYCNSVFERPYSDKTYRCEEDPGGYGQEKSCVGDLLFPKQQ